VREVKANSATRLIPFVLITGLSDRQDRLLGIESGADDFLNKPIFPEDCLPGFKSLLKLKEFTDELETAESVLCTLGLSVESRDPYTEGHCERLALNASNLGRHLGLDPESIVALRRGGYLHDLGKIAVPDEILKKGTNLSRRVGGDEIASCHRRNHLPAAQVAAAGVADHSQSSRALRWQRISRRSPPERNPATRASAAGRGRLRCTAHRPTYKPHSATSRRRSLCVKKPEPESGMKSWWESSFPCWRASGK